VKFWDASAIVPLLVAETTTRSLQGLARRDSDMLVWWGSQVECASALARLERGALLDGKAGALAFDRLKQLADGWHQIEPSEIVRENALRFLRVHPLRAAACGGFSRGRTTSFVARNGDARRASRRGSAKGRFRVG
jgi:predicted nucleic acid-binding protein